MEEYKQVVRDVLEEMELKFSEHEHSEDIYAFKFGLTLEGKYLDIAIYLESDPQVCRIDAVYPFRAETDFVYPLCEKMAKENYPRRYGALQYDANDGELSYRYSFPIRHGLYEDVMADVLRAVIVSADRSFDVVKQFAIGRLKRAEREECICKAQKLIVELDS